MIEVWSLPGPKALVSAVLEDLLEGRQCLLHGAPPPGLRRAVEDALGAHQIRLRVVDDDPTLHPLGVLRREAAAGFAAASSIMPGVWWVDGVQVGRAAIWANEAAQIAELVRQHPPASRPLLAVPLWGDPGIRGLNVIVRRAEPLLRIDLEVAARYAAADAGETGLVGRLRLAVAVEMAMPHLPRTAALDALDHWMHAPRAALCDPRRFAEHAAAVGDVITMPAFALWGAQHSALLGEIERLRLEIVRAEARRWKIPYTEPASEGRLPKQINEPELLELKHLCAQLREAGHPPSFPLRRRLEALRELRNALSHLQPVVLAELNLLEEAAAS